jgi:tRNA dimethylallyltransferase
MNAAFPPLVTRYQAIVVAGPTCAGKSALAVQAAQRLGGEIVGADAFQIYQGLDLLTAKPSAGERAAVPHHLIGEIPLTAEFDVAQYLTLAERRLAAIRERGKVPVIVGGTGLYIRALIRGLAELPPTDPVLREELAAQPLPALQQRLAELDPVGAAQIDLKNPRRVIRALEVCLAAQKPYSSFRNEWEASPSADCGIVVMRDREELYARIDRRVEAMFAEGIAEEVERAGDALSRTAQQTLGWREIRQLLAGEITQEACIASIQQATRRYAKRQVTWFRAEKGLRHADPCEVIAHLKALVAA